MAPAVIVRLRRVSGPRAMTLMALRTEYRRRLSTLKASMRALELSEMLFETPAISVGQAAKVLGVTARGGQQLVDKLVKAGILREVTGKKRGRVYVAWEVVGVMEYYANMRAMKSPLSH